MIEIIKSAIKDSEKVYWKEHALMRMRQRNIRVDDIMEAVKTSIIIETYTDDKPFPSVLVCGRTIKETRLHIVIGVNTDEGEIHIITGYKPDPLQWDETFTRRIRK